MSLILAPSLFDKEKVCLVFLEEESEAQWGAGCDPALDLGSLLFVPPPPVEIDSELICQGFLH